MCSLTVYSSNLSSFEPHNYFYNLFFSQFPVDLIVAEISEKSMSINDDCLHHPSPTLNVALTHEGSQWTDSSGSVELLVVAVLTDSILHFGACAAERIHCDLVSGC